MGRKKLEHETVSFEIVGGG